MKIVVMIPSRMGSTRFPNKPMAKIYGREMVLWVCDRVAEKYEPIVVTPDMQIYRLVTLANYRSVMTGECPTGTDRIAEASNKVDADMYVNVQGDEPVVNIEDITEVIQAKLMHPNAVIGSMRRLEHNDENVVKVVVNAGQLIDMTRQGTGRFAQCGIYAFNKWELDQFGNVPNSFKQRSLGTHENIEIMRFMDLGVDVRMVEIQGGPAVDTPGDIKRVMEVIKHGRKWKTN